MISQVEKLFVNLVRQYVADFRQQVDKEITAAQIHLLEMLYEHGATKMSDLAEHLQVTVGAVTLQADRLIKLGLIDRGRSELDRRVVLLSMTDEGRNLIEQVRNVRRGVLDRYFGKLTEEELQQAAAIFRKVLEK